MQQDSINIRRIDSTPVKHSSCYFRVNVLLFIERQILATEISYERRNAVEVFS